MKSILQQLYDGELYPGEQLCSQLEEYREKRGQYSSHYENFMEQLSSLNPQLGEQFSQIIEEQMELIPYEGSELFINGFRMGAKMMLEILWQNEKEGEFPEKSKN